MWTLEPGRAQFESLLYHMTHHIGIIPVLGDSEVVHIAKAS